MSKGPFKLKSGNTTPFKMMGSSPVKQDYDAEGNWIGAGPHPKSRYAQMSDTEKLEYDKSKKEYLDVLEPKGSDVTPPSIKEGEEGKLLAEKKELTPEMGHTIVSRTGRSPGPGYEKIKGTNQWEYTGYGV